MEEEKKEIREMDLVSRDNIKFLLDIELSDLLYRYHTKTMKTNIILITFQFICLFVDIILQIFIPKDNNWTFNGFTLKNIISFSYVFIVWFLAIIVVINNKIRTEAWKQSKEELNELMTTVTPAFKKNYNLNIDYQIITKIGEYKKKVNKTYRRNMKKYEGDR